MLFLTTMTSAVSTGVQIQEQAPLAPFTTLGVGGPARFFTVIDAPEKIPAAMEFARQHQCPVFVLGGGSNIVVADAGFNGLVLKIAISGISLISEERPIVRLSAGAGVQWDDFAQYCVEHDYAGTECLSGIPGTVGGVPIQNAGAYGQEAGDLITAVNAWDRKMESMTRLSRKECAFSYRSSIFNTAQSGRYIILSVEFALHLHGAPCIQYADLKQKFSGNKQHPSLKQVRAAVMEIRQSKGMVVRKEDPDSKSAGSFFKNPIISAAALSGLGDIPYYSMPDGAIKIPAAWLIERAGFTKGFTRGCAGLSSKHSLALINRGGATAQDIINSMIEIQRRVQDAFGIRLQPEPIFVGFDAEPDGKE